MKAHYDTYRRQGWPADAAITMARIEEEKRSNRFDSDEGEREHRGHVFQYKVERDDMSGAPWEHMDLLAEVRSGYNSYPPRGWVQLPGRYQYHRAEALDGTWKWAKSEQHAQAIVEQEIELLRSFLNGDWCYVGLTVTLEGVGDESLWGIEGDYAYSYFEDLADELLQQKDRKTYPVTEFAV